MNIASSIRPLVVSGALVLAACAVPPGPGKSPAAAGEPRGIAMTQSAPVVASAAAASTATAAAPVTVAAAPAAPALAAPASAPAGPPPLPPIMGFNDAVLFAANNMLKGAASAIGDAAGNVPLVIDPLIDGNSGVQSVATQSMESRVVELVRSSYPRFEVQPFSTSTLARAPYLFIGTFTAVDKDGKSAGTKEWYRVCLALLDLHTGKIVSKGFARAKPDGVDATPTQFFVDSPAWAPDTATDGYVKTCQGTKAGDPINPAYWDKIVAAAMINDAITAYTGGRYEEALDLYRGVARMPAGDQLRVHNGIYLSAWKLGRKPEAEEAFGRIVQFGLANKRLGVKFLFRPGSTLFINEQQVAGPYPGWIKQIAARSGQQSNCLEVAGHTSRTGPEPLNERLSTLRAQYVKQRLEADVPALVKRSTAVGRGSAENITGLGTDDARDALDRRVEFKVVECAAN